MSLERCQSAPLSITEDAASTSSIQEHVENTPMETNNTPTKVQQRQTETPRDSKKPLTDEEAKKRRIQYVLHMLNSDKYKAEIRYRSCKACKSRRNVSSRTIPEKCPNCVKVFDDIVRQVHADLLSGKLIMVGITRTRTTVPKTCNRKVQTSQRMAHCNGCQCHLREEDRTPYQRDFSGGTLSANQCQCQRCKDEGNTAVWVRLGKESSGASHSRWQKTRPAPYHTRRAHTPCEDEALKDLHNHVLAGDQNLPGETFIKVLGSLHGQGPCRKDCKLKADVAWMKKRVPKQVGTQTCLTRDMSVQTASRMPRTLRNQATQAHFHSSVGIQKGTCLARIRAAKASWHRTAAIQVCMPELSHTHRPVGKVVGVQSRI